MRAGTGFVTSSLTPSQAIRALTAIRTAQLITAMWKPSAKGRRG